MIGYIYLTTNTANGKKYVGKRQKERFDKNYIGSGVALKSAVNIYGKDAFETIVLEPCKTEKELCEAEKKWINAYRKQGVELYNIADGGTGGNVVDWDSIPQSKRQEINEKNRLSHLGEKNPFFGKKHTELSRKLMSEHSANRGKCRPQGLIDYKNNQRNALPQIAQIDPKTNRVVDMWENWCEAGEHINPSQRCAYAHISECCNHKRKTAYGYIWRYVTEVVV